MSSKPEAITALTGKDPSCEMGRSAVIRKMATHFPPHPHVMLLVDLGRGLALAPRMAAGMQEGAANNMPGFPVLIGPDGHGPLAGWSLSVTNRSARGDVFISHRDMRGIVRMFRQY